MRKIQILISTILFISCAPKISDDNITSDLTKYLNYVQEGNYTEAVSYMPDKFWDFYNKEDYVARLNELTKKTGNILTEDIEVKNISETKKIENRFFKVIEYQVQYSFDSSKIPERVIDSYKTKLGENNVKIDTIRHRIKIQIDNSAISVLEKDEKEWKFLELNQNSITKLYGLDTWLELH